MGKRGKAPLGLMLTVLIIVAVSFLSFLTTSSRPIQAAPPLPTLPPRATPTPTSVPDTKGGGKSSRADDTPVGAYIMLQVQSPQYGIWTIVQWQDQVGVWHDVEGWQGALDQGNTKVWWVAETDFGKGPFRWAIYQGQDGPRLATSTPFDLPSEADETIQIRVSSGL